MSDHCKLHSAILTSAFGVRLRVSLMPSLLQYLLPRLNETERTGLSTSLFFIFIGSLKDKRNGAKIGNACLTLVSLSFDTTIITSKY